MGSTSSLHKFYIDYFLMITNSLSSCFVMGILIALLYLNSKLINVKISSILLIASSVLTVYIMATYPIGHSPIYGVLFSIIMYSFLCIDKQIKLHIPRWIIFIGDISYSIYLTQYITVKILEKHCLNFFAGVQNKYFMVIPYLLIIVLVSYVFYNFAEEKLNAICKTKLTQLFLAKKQ